MRKITLFLLLIASTANAGSEMFIDAGLGIFSTEGQSLSQVKFGKVGIQNDLTGPLVYRVNGGLWLDNRHDGNLSSGFASTQLGFDVKNEMLEMGIFSGPGLITKADDALGGHFQFNETVFIGVHDPKGDTSVGFAYNHFSSAGLEMPNMGKDFGCLEIKFPF